MKITLFIAQSIDGFVATKDQSVAWLDAYNEGVEYGTQAFIDNADTVIQGNTTFKQFKSKYPKKNNYVFSKNADSLSEEGVIFVKGKIKEFINTLDKNTHKKIWLVGGPSLVKQFLNEKQIDEMIIFTMPVLLNDGISLFSNVTTTSKMSLKKIEKFSNGVIMSQYTVGY